MEDETDPLFSQATRLQERLQRSGGRSHSVKSLVRALEERNRLLSSAVSISVSDAENPEQTATWKIDLARHPDIIEFKSSFTGPTYVINKDALASRINEGAFEGSRVVNDVIVTNIKEGKNVIRADASGIARDGFLYDEEMINEIVAVLSDTGTGSINIATEFRKGIVSIKEGNTVKQLTLLASGRSNFDNSPANREFNVRKALNEYLNNTLIRPGESYSFIGAIDAPVTLEKGWKEALGLFGGGSAMTPGGGICQTSTTLYRAALLAGLPIVYKRNHSLHVSYYEEYGVGMDSTIFPGVHDLEFENDSNEWMLVQSYAEGNDAIVNIYGIDNGRSVSMEGPYFVNTRPRPKELRALGYDEIGWVRRITFADGREMNQSFISTYSKPIAYNSLSKKYAVGIVGDTVHAAAPEQAE